MTGPDKTDLTDKTPVQNFHKLHNYRRGVLSVLSDLSGGKGADDGIGIATGKEKS